MSIASNIADKTTGTTMQVATSAGNKVIKGAQAAAEPINQVMNKRIKQGILLGGIVSILAFGLTGGIGGFIGAALFGMAAGGTAGGLVSIPIGIFNGLTSGNKKPEANAQNNANNTSDELGGGMGAGAAIEAAPPAPEPVYAMPKTQTQMASVAPVEEIAPAMQREAKPNVDPVLASQTARLAELNRQQDLPNDTNMWQNRVNESMGASRGRGA